MSYNEMSNDSYVASKVLMDNLDPRLVNYFENHIKHTEFLNYFYEQMSPWLFRHLKSDFTMEITLFDIVYFAFETITSQYDDSMAAYKAYAENNRSRRNYFFKVIKEEYEGNAKAQNPYYLKNQADSYFGLLPFDTSLKIYSSKQEYMDMLYEQIVAWRKTKNSRLIEFMYFEKMPEKRRYECYICDICVNLLEIVTQQYFGNYNGGLTIIPQSLIETGIFGFKSMDIPLDITVEKDRVVATNSFSYEDIDDTCNVVDIVMDEYSGDFSTYNDEEKQFLIKQLRSNGTLKTSAEALDSRDETVLATVYSSFNASVLTEDWIRIPGRSFVSQVLGKTNLRARDIKGVLKSLDKLAVCQIRTEQKNTSTGKVTARGILSFFDVRYGLKDDNSTITAKLSTGSDLTSATSCEISDEDLTSDKWTIEIAPSAFLKEMWRERVNTEIYTKLYQTTTGPKTKSLMMILQNERLKQYPVLEICLTYALLKNRMRMDVKTSVLKNELVNQLEILKEQEIIVKRYELLSTGVQIEFLPFTDIEKLLYKIDAASSIYLSNHDPK